MSERTLDDALAHANQLRQWRQAGKQSTHAIDDMALLADELLRLRGENKQLRLELGSANAMIATEFD